jgi:phospholipase A1
MDDAPAGNFFHHAPSNFQIFFYPLPIKACSGYMQLVECPSIYEMLPNPDFKWKDKPIIQVWRKNPEKDGMVELVLYEATDCVSLFEEALRNNEVVRLRLAFSLKMCSNVFQGVFYF